MVGSIDTNTYTYIRMPLFLTFSLSEMCVIRYSTVEAIVAAALSLPETNQREIIARITAAIGN